MLVLLLFGCRPTPSVELSSAGLGGQLDADGLVAWQGDDALGVQLSAWGRDGALTSAQPVGPVEFCSPRCEVRFERPGLTGWWRSSDTGLEQGWEVHSRPPGQGELVLALQLDGADWVQVDEDALGVAIGTPAARWSYGGLRAWDATGQELPARMEATSDGLAVRVDDAGARYPLVVDPTLNRTVTLTLSEAAANDYFGYAVAGAGDVNNDGYDDIIGGATLYRVQTENIGAAFVFLGGPDGVDPTTELELQPSETREGMAFGATVAGVGDVDGDGYDDVVVGSTFADAEHRGSATLWHGSAGGIDPATELTFQSADVLNSDQFGKSVARAGDLNGDGYNDVIIGAPSVDEKVTSGGAVYVAYGSANGLAVDSMEKLFCSNPVKGDTFGRWLAGAGDTNGDGYDDIIVGTKREGESWGAVYVYQGSADGLDPDTEIQLGPSDGKPGDQYGTAVAGVGDMDGDGYDDVIVGSNFRDEKALNSGGAFIYYGSAAGVTQESERRLTPSDGEQSDQFGYAVSAAGDVDGDGYDDAIIGARYAEKDKGAAYVYFGGPDGVDGSRKIKRSSGAGKEDLFGASVAGAGDVNADGLADVIIGAYNDNTSDGEDAGTITIIDSACIAVEWFEDDDGDGFGDPDEPADTACDQPASATVEDNTDCDDDDETVNPGATETLGDGVDSNCDGEGGGPDSDDDEDGLTWAEEQELGTSDATKDTDGDGSWDPTELQKGTDPLNPDTDGDGIPDGDEILLGTDPLDPDTDGDGVSDGDEVAAGTDPLDPDSKPEGYDDDDDSEGRGCSHGGRTGGLALLMVFGLFRRRETATPSQANVEP